MEIAYIGLTLFNAAGLFIKAIIGLFGIGLIITVHELGHYLIARLFDVHIPSFSIGFGPRLLSKKIGDTTFSLSALPLGGYVELAGSFEPGQGEQLSAHDSSNKSFQSKPYWQKFLVMMGGILFNLLFAYGVFISLCYLGLPEHRALAPFTATTSIASIEPGSLAERAGLKPNDIIMAINGTEITKGRHIFQLLYANQESITVSLKHSDGKIEDVLLAPPSTEDKISQPMRGITLISDSKCYTTIPKALAGGFNIANAIIAGTARALAQIVKTRDTKQLMGPIALINQTAQEGSHGMGRLLLFLAIISINLAIINLLPLPILDGGQLLLYTIEALIGRQLPLRQREILFILCWILTLLIIIPLTYRDLGRILNLR